MTRKFLREMLDEARSKDQQIKGQRAMLDQKIKAEYDKLTKEVPSPSQRRKKKRVTDIQESDWTPISGPGPTNSASQSFQHFSGSTVTVSGLGGVESTPSTVTIGFEGETFDVAAPTYSQLAMQGYAPPLPMLKRRDNVNVNARLDASQEFAQKVGSDAFMNARVQSGEFTPKQQAAIDAWNAELRSTMDRHGAEWEAVLKKDGGYDPEKHKGLQARQGAEIEAVWDKEPKFDVPPDPSVPLDYDPFKGVDAPEAETEAPEAESEPKVDPYADRILELNVALDKMKEKGTLISHYKLIGPGEEGYVDTTNMANAIGYNRKPIYTAPAQEMFAELERLYELQLAWLEKQNPGGEVQGADDALDDYNSSMGPNSEPPSDAPEDPNEPVPTPDDDLLDQLAKLFGVGSAKNFLDHYADNFVKGDGKQDQNLTNLLSKNDRNWLKNALAGDSAITNPKRFDNPQDAFSQLMQRAPRGIRNSIGNGAKLDMNYYNRTGDFKIDKSYVFTEPRDFGARSGSNALSNIGSLGTAGYARSKAGGNPFANASSFINNPMRFHVIIPGPKRKRNFGESTWSKMNRLLNDEHLSVIKTQKSFKDYINEKSSSSLIKSASEPLKSFADFMVEGMTSKDFKDIYGGYVVTSIMSQSPELTGDETAQNILKHSANATNYAFGVNFPGSYINSIGDFDSPQSLSFADIQAHLARASDDKAAAAPHGEDHVFAYQSTDYVLPTAEQMTANMTTVASADFFSDQMKQMIWPSYGQVSPIPGTDEHGNLSLYSYPWNRNRYPDDARFEALGYDMSNLTAEQQERVIRERVSFVGGKYGGVSGTYHKDNHFLDITYGTARSIDETSFDLVSGGIYNWDDPVEWPNLQQLDLGPGWGWEYRSSPDDDHSLTKEHWQYQENSMDFTVSHLEDIIGVTFPERLHTKFMDSDGVYKEYLQPGGFHYDMEEGDLPGTNDVNYAEAWNECSAHKKIIQNARAGDVITFDYRIASEQWDNTFGYDITGNGDGPYYDSFSDEPNDLYVVAGKRVMLAWSMFRELPDDEVTDEHPMGFVLTNPNSPVDTGTFSYTIQQEDINPVTGALDFVTAYHADDIYFHRVSITNFAINEGNKEKTDAGQTGKTTDAYNLGAPVAALDATKNSKKKKDEEEEEEIFGSEQKELSAKDAELQVKEKQRLENVAAIESAEKKFMQGINKQVEEAIVELDNGASTWKGEVNSRWDMSAGKFRDMTIDPKNPSQIPGMKGVKWINSLEELENAGTTADMGDSFYSSHLISLINGRFQRLDREELDKLIKSPAVRADFLARTSPSFRKWILSVPTDRDYSKSGWTLTSNGSGDFFPPYKANGLNVDGLDHVFTGMDIGQRTGWWLPDDGSWKAYQEIKEAVRRAWGFFGWSRYGFPGKSDSSDSSDPGPTQDFELEDISWELLKKAERDSNSLTPEELEMIKKYIAQDEKNPKSSDNDDPYHLNLGQIIKKFGSNVGNELGKILQTLSTFRHAGEAFANFLLQQQGLKKYTKKNPYKVKLPKEDALAIAKTINNVLETQIPRERWNDLSQEDLDKINDAVNPESGPTPTNKYREGTGANKDEYHNIFNNLGERKGVKVKVINGKPYVTELNDNYVFTDPDDATVQGAPELIKFFTTAGGAQDRKDAAGGGEYTYQQWSGDINNLDLKMKNMPIRMKLPIPTSEPMSEEYINEISGAALIKSARKAKNETDTLRAKLEPGYKNKRTKQMHKFAIAGVKKLRSEVEEDYKNLPRDRMAKQYDRKKDKNYDEFHKQNPMGIGPRVSRGKSDTQIDQHGNSRQTKAISGQLKNNPRFYDSSHEQWQRMQSKFKSRKNSDATGEVARRLNPSRKKKKL